MEVQLIQYSPNPELLIAAAARLCYKDVGAVDLINNLSRDDVTNLLDTVISSGHFSVLEHVTFTFGIDGISRILSHQIVRHRVGIALSQQSQRYTKLVHASYVAPKSIESNMDLSQRFRELTETCIALYYEMQNSGIPKEDARFILPQAVTTRLVMTVNMRQLINMYSSDACFRSQWEMRQLMTCLKREIRKVSPRLASELKIKCFKLGYCDEKIICEELKEKMPSRNELSQNGHLYSNDFYKKLSIHLGEE